MNRIIEYLKYYHQARSIKKLHSPIAYSFAKEILENKDQYYAFNDIETLRKKYLKDDSLLDFEDPGAGSRKHNSNTRKVKDIANSSLSDKRQCRELFHLVRWSGAKNILELGTSLGISSLYLSAWSSTSNIYTIEGAKPVAQLAYQSFRNFKKQNIHLASGTFNAILPDICKKMGTIDLAFIDGHHEKKSCLRYYKLIKGYCHEESIIVIDDIYWSGSMKSAWETLKVDSDVTMSLDLFYYGVLLYSPKIKEKRNIKLVRKALKPWQFVL